MKFVEPGIEYWPQAEGLAGMWSQIARVTRLSYDSKPREGETDEEFIERVVLKPSRINQFHYDFDRQHGGVLEFGTIYLIVPSNKYRGHDIEYYFPEDFDGRLLLSSPNRVNHEFALTNNDGEHCFYITTNLRYILENEIEWLCKQYIVDRSTPFHKQRYCFRVVTDRGVSAEWNRHRSSMSINEASTRHIDFSMEKHGGGISYAKPCWPVMMSHEFFKGDKEQMRKFVAMCKEVANGGEVPSWSAGDYYAFALKAAEFSYKGLRDNAWRPEQARQVLNLNTKTEVAYCAYEDAWRHFLKLRSSHAVSGKAHPNITPLADTLEEVLNEVTEKQ